MYVCVFINTHLLFKRRLSIFHFISSIRSNMQIKLCTINYRGRVTTSSSVLHFRRQTPIQATYRTPIFTIVVFQNGKCRIMGSKKPITQSQLQQLPFKIKLEHLQSCTFTIDFESTINLHNLHNALGSRMALFEPEIFPALRLLAFNPMCVNVFSSGKTVIMGYKSTKLDNKFVNQIYLLIWKHTDQYKLTHKAIPLHSI